MKKRLFSILLVLALLCSLLPQAALSARAECAPVFEDVPEDAYYKKAVDWAVENGITSGTTATTFSPKKTCTRAEVMTFLWAAAGREKTDAENPFTDISADKYYYRAVLWAVERGITGGTSASTFSPKKGCTRAEVVTFLWAFAGRPTVDIENPFEDVTPGKYYYKAVLWAVENNVTGGVSSTLFGVGRPCKREQAMTFLWNACGSPEPTSADNPFTYVIAGKYYYKAVLWAVENGVTGGVSATLFGVGRTCTRA